MPGNEDIPIYIDPRKAQSGHIQTIPGCGTFGHKQIIKEMMVDELKKKD